LNETDERQPLRDRGRYGHSQFEGIAGLFAGFTLEHSPMASTMLMDRLGARPLHVWLHASLSLDGQLFMHATS
jgi:hypothetical protein